MRIRHLVIVVMLCLLGMWSRVGAAEYGIKRIGCLPGDTNSTAIGVNDSGQVVGLSWGDGLDHVFTWDATSGMHELQCTLPNTNTAWATAINRFGCSIGWTYDLKLERQRAVLWNSQGQSVELVGLANDMNNYAAGINDAGKVVGSSSDIWGHDHAMLWDPVTGLRELGGISSGVSSSATAINNSGRIAGWSGTGYSHPVWWDAAFRVHDIGLLAGCETGYASDINNGGEIVGVMGDLWLNYPRAFYWSSAGGLRDLRPGYRSEAVAINTSGLIVGWSGGATGNRAYLWNRSSSGQELFTPSGYDYSMARDINQLGCVAGEIETSNGRCEAVVWDPVPEPSCIVALSAGLLGLIWRKRS